MANNSSIYNVKFSFTGDASQLKAELNQLKKSLGDLATTKPVQLVGKMTTSEITKATDAAARLKIALEQATNVNTGKLNLTSFMTQLSSSGLTLREYREQLQQLGPEGQLAFQQLTNALMSAEHSLFQGSAMLEKMKKSLANVFQWNVSSSIFNFITGQIKSAFGYAQDLNKCLTDISIVSGKNAQSMQKFAKEANAAAKALNTTTRAYTEASLIYFQQGLSDTQVKERTDITIKMANVTGEAAQDVSSYMTAIWNNFYDGSESLEHYADVITALGAATASSSEEIAGGLEKFAAIADTVGLSYEYATAALATVVSATRQSEDTVGTAFKTIFGRMQSLNLGETLEDGVDLTKYSGALKTVGVEVLGANGELRKMDDILVELGEKWGRLDEKTKVALANTLAGTRQYANFMALMDNYSEFEVNLKIAEDAEGTLQEQADIYGHSWEAATNRVRAAAESVYDSLINSDFMIGLLDFLTKLISKVELVTKALGGVGGILTSIGMWIIKIKREEITAGLARTGQLIQNIVHPMKAIDFKKDVVKQSVLSYGDTITGSADEVDSVISNASMTGIRKSRAQMKTRRQKRKEGTWSAGEETAFNTGDLGELDTGYKRIAALQTKIAMNAAGMTAAEKQQAQAILNRQLGLEKELRLKEIALEHSRDELETLVAKNEWQRQNHEEEMAHIKAEAEEKRKAAEAERIYNEKVEKLKHTAARAELYRKDTGLQSKAKKITGAETMAAAATTGSRTVTNYDAANHIDADKQLKTQLSTIMTADADVNYLDDYSKKVIQDTMNQIDKGEGLSEVDLTAINEVLENLRIDAKTIVRETKTEIEEMVAEAGGDVVTATSRQGIRAMAQAEGAEATNKAIKNITGVQNVGSRADYSEGMINEDGSINANTDARLQREAEDEAFASFATPEQAADYDHKREVQDKRWFGTGEDGLSTIAERGIGEIEQTQRITDTATVVQATINEDDGALTQPHLAPKVSQSMTDARNMNIELDDEEDMSFMNDMPDKLKSGNATSEELDRLAKVLQEIQEKANKIVENTREEVEKIVAEGGGDGAKAASDEGLAAIATGSKEDIMKTTMGVNNETDMARKTESAAIQDVAANKPAQKKGQADRKAAREELTTKKTQVKVTKQLEKEITALMKVEKKDEKQKKRLDKLLKKYNKTVGRTADENEDVEKSFKEAKKEADKLEKEVKDLTAEYRRLAGAGEDVDLELKGMDDIAEANAEMENMADTTEEMGEDGSEALDGLNENAMTTSELITTAGEAVMGLAATFQSVQGLLTIWNDEDVGWAEKIIATVTAMIGLIPTLTAVYKLLTATRKKDIAAQGAQVASDAVKTASTKANTTGLWANVQAMMSNPYMAAAVAAAIVAAIAAVAIVTGMQTAELEANTEALEANSEAAQESMEKEKERVDAVREEVDAVNASAEAYANKTGSIEDYYKSAVKAAEELRKQFGEDIYVGDMDYFAANSEEILKQINQAYLKNLNDAVTQGSNSLKAISANAAHTMKTTLEVGGKNDTGADDVQDIVNSKKDDGTDYKYLTATSDGLKVDFNADDPKQAVEAYEEMLEVQRELSEAGEENSESYAAVSAWLSDNKEKYEELAGAVEDYNAIVTEASYLNYQKANPNKDFADMSLEEYYRARQKMIQEAINNGASEEDMESYLLSQTDTSAIENRIQHMEDIAKVTGKSTAEILDYYNSLSYAEQKGFDLVSVADYIDAERTDVELGRIGQRAAEAYAKSFDGALKTAQGAVGLTDETLTTYAQTLLGTNKELEEFTNEEKAAVASTLQLDKGLKGLVDTWEDNYDAMLTSKKGSVEYLNAVTALSKGVGEAFGIEISEDWIAKDNNASLVARLLSGDSSVLAEIQTSIATDLIANTDLSTNLQSSIEHELANLAAQDLDLGQVISTEGLLDSLNLAIAQGLDPAKAVEILKASGFEAVWGETADGDQIIKQVVRSVDESSFGENYLEVEIDRVTQYERSLEHLERKLDRLTDAKEKAFGANRRKAIEDEIAGVEKLKQKNIEYLGTLEEEKNKALDNLTGTDGVLSNLGVTAKIDQETGEIINRDEIIAMSGGSEGVIEAIENYEDWLDTIGEVKDEVYNLDSQLEDLAWEDYEYTIELRVALKETQLSKIEFELTKLEGKGYAIGASIGIIGQQLDLINEDSNARIAEANEALSKYGLTIEEVQSLASTEEGMAHLMSLGIDAQTMTKIQELPGLLQENLLAAQEARTQVEELFVSRMEELYEDFDASFAKFDILTSALDSYTSIIDIVGSQVFGADAVKQTEKMAQASMTALTRQFEASQSQISALNDQMLQAQESLKYASDEDAVEYWQTQIETIQEKLDEANANMMDSWESALQAAADLFNAKVATAIADMEKAISASFGNLSNLQQAYDQQSTINAQYLDDFSQMYELSKMSRNISNSIDATTNIKARKELAALQDEIANIQKNNVKMSQHDLQLLQMKYDLRLAEIALEDAQNAKSQVRLQRDAEGNLSYIYTANESKLDQAQQAYEDKMYAIQQTNASYLQEIEGQMLGSAQEMMDALQEIAESALDPAQKEALMKQTQEFYNERYRYMSEEYEKTISSNKELYDKDLKLMEEYKHDKITIGNGLVTEFSSSILGKLTGSLTASDFSATITNAFGTAVTAVGQAMDDYSVNISAIMEKAGVTGEDGFAKKIEEEISGDNGIIAQSADALQNVKDTGDELTSTYSTLSGAVTGFQKDYEEAMLAVEASTNKAIDGAITLVSVLTGKTKAQLDLEYKTKDVTDAENELINEAPAEENLEDLPSNTTDAMADNLDKETDVITESAEAIVAKTTEYQTKVLTALGIIAGHTKLLEHMSGKIASPVAFDTGGYTGVWGAEGRLGILHEKELVLNASDTSNLLASLDIASNILTQISNPMEMFKNIADMTNALNLQSSTLDQNVTITAEFPNVNNHSEIEQAFENIVNMAAQYAKHR